MIMQRFDMDNYTFRPKPGDDIFDSIDSFIREKKIEAGCVLSGVGSLTRSVLRLSNRDPYSEYEGHFVIVSLTGTVSRTVRTCMSPFPMGMVKRLAGTLFQDVKFTRLLRLC